MGSGIHRDGHGPFDHVFPWVPVGYVTIALHLPGTAFHASATGNVGPTCLTATCPNLLRRFPVLSVRTYFTQGAWAAATTDLDPRGVMTEGKAIALRNWMDAKPEAIHLSR